MNPDEETNKLKFTCFVFQEQKVDGLLATHYWIF